MAWTYDLRPRVAGVGAGIGAILGAVLLLSLSDALVKLAGDRLGLAQLVLLRSLVASVLLAAGLWAMGGRAALVLRRPGWVWARSLSLTAMWLCYYAALPAMALPLAAACYYLSPVWMSLMARGFLGIAIGPRGWCAIALSAAGVLLAVAPSPGSLTPVMLLPLAAGGFYALAGILTWSRTREESAGAMALNLNLCLCSVAGIALAGLALNGAEAESFVLAFWPPLTWNDLALVVLLGLLLAVIATGVALAYRLAPTPVVGLFDSAYLGFAALWSALLFAEPPGLREGAGIALIAAGAVLMGFRGRR